MPSKVERKIRLAIEARKPRRVLKWARRATGSGEYQAALRGFVWFHRNALRHGSGLHGVRLSFALADWLELGAVYPPALERFEAIVEKHVLRLSRGRGGYRRFVDARAMLHYLGRDDETLALFRAIETQSQARAAEIFPSVRDDLISRADYATCSRYTHPEDLAMYGRQLQFDSSWDEIPTGYDPRAQFVKRIDAMIETLWGAGRFSEAREVAADAINHLDSDEVRTALSRARRRVGEKRRRSGAAAGPSEPSRRRGSPD